MTLSILNHALRHLRGLAAFAFAPRQGLDIAVIGVPNAGDVR